MARTDYTRLNILEPFGVIVSSCHACCYSNKILFTCALHITYRAWYGISHLGLIDLVKVVDKIFFAEVSPWSINNFKLSMCVGINILMHVASLNYAGCLHSCTQTKRHYEREKERKIYQRFLERERGLKILIASKAW